MAKRKTLSEAAAEAQEKRRAQPLQETLSPPTPEEIAAAIGARERPQETGSRPPKPKRLNVDLEPDFYDAVKEKAEREYGSIAKAVRALLEIYLET